MHAGVILGILLGHCQNSDARFVLSGHFPIMVNPFREKSCKTTRILIILHFHFHMENIGKIRRFPEV